MVVFVSNVKQKDLKNIQMRVFEITSYKLFTYV